MSQGLDLYILIDKLMITFTKYYLCTLSSQPRCLKMVPLELKFSAD